MVLALQEPPTLARLARPQRRVHKLLQRTTSAATGSPSCFTAIARCADALDSSERPAMKTRSSAMSAEPCAQRRGSIG